MFYATDWVTSAPHKSWDTSARNFSPRVKPRDSPKAKPKGSPRRSPRVDSCAREAIWSGPGHPSRAHSQCRRPFPGSLVGPRSRGNQHGVRFPNTRHRLTHGIAENRRANHADCSLPRRSRPCVAKVARRNPIAGFEGLREVRRIAEPRLERDCRYGAPPGPGISQTASTAHEPASRI